MKNSKKSVEKIVLLEDLKMSRLSFNFFMIYVIHKMVVLFKNIIFKCFFEEYNRLLFFNIIFFHNIW